jgi:hypothetical protein
MSWLLCADNAFYTPFTVQYFSKSSAGLTASSKAKSLVTFLLLYRCGIWTIKLK